MLYRNCLPRILHYRADLYGTLPIRSVPVSKARSSVDIRQRSSKMRGARKRFPMRVRTGIIRVAEIRRIKADKETST
jgi:hypothetical protein